jgi:chromosomal replication initiation ATPase DnaA
MRVWKDLVDRGYSLTSIGRAFDRDHTTILSGLRRLQKLQGKVG